MRKNQPQSAAYCLLAVVSALTAHAEVVTLKPVADTSIISDGVNPRGNETILVGTRTIGIMDRGLLKFDLSSIPSGATVQLVTLKLTVVMVPRAPADSNFDLYRMLTAWDESANWLNATVGHSWGAAGALAGVDYQTKVSATQLVQDLGTYEFGPDEGLRSDVAAWIRDPASNRGWLLKSESESTPSSARHFGSRESADAPQLVIEYSLPAQAPVLSVPRLTNGICSFSFPQMANHSYQVEAIADLSSTAWNVVTNFPATPGANTAVVTNRPQGERRFFRVRQD